MLSPTLRLSLFLVLLTPAGAAFSDDDPCTRFTWNVTRELAVMRQTPLSVEAGVNSGAPQLALDKLYDVKLAPQSKVLFAAKPGKPTLDDGGQGGLLRFKTDKAGSYRIAITSGHWIDVVDGARIITSRDFQGHRGCERPRKIVEYELPAGRDLLIQLSGSTGAQISLAMTFVTGGGK